MVTCLIWNFFVFIAFISNNATRESWFDLIFPGRVDFVLTLVPLISVLSELMRMIYDLERHTLAFDGAIFPSQPPKALPMRPSLPESSDSSPFGAMPYDVRHQSFWKKEVGKVSSWIQFLGRLEKLFLFSSTVWRSVCVLQEHFGPIKHRNN